MADQSDVETALLDAVLAALYPLGTDAPPAIAAPARAHRGWPLPAALNADLARGLVTVSVIPVDGSLRVTTRYPGQWTQAGATSPALVAAVTGDQVRFAGTAARGQLAGILADGFAAVHRTQPGDTPAHVAAGLAGQLRVRRIVIYTDSALIIPGARDLRARVVADRPAMRELRRQTQQFRIACFCPTPALRDDAARTIDTALAAIRFLALADGTFAHLTAESTATTDEAEQALLYRRDLLLRAEYATTLTANLPAMIFGAGQLNAAPFIG
jgi:hypothetical protein